MSTSDLEIVLGALPILGIDPPEAPYLIEALGDGMDQGSPEAVIASVASMLMDGEKSKITRYGNLEAKIPLRIRGADLDVVADGLAAVMAEVNKGRNTLQLKPPGIDTVSVFDVVTARLQFLSDDLSDRKVIRKFMLVLECLPFARRAEPTVVVAEPIPAGTPPVWTTIDACTSLTGWTAAQGNPNPTLAVGSTAIQVANTLLVDSLGLTRSGLSVSMASGDYLVVDWEAKATLVAPNTVLSVNGTPRQPAAVVTMGASRWRWFVPVSEKILSVSVQVDTYTLGGYLLVHDLSKVNQLPFMGTTLQRPFTAAIGGTARTQADLVVETDFGIDLGEELLVYTAPVGAAMDPPLQRWRTSGAAITPDGTAVSGGRAQLTTPAEFVFPIPDSGAHLILGRLRSTSGSPLATLSWAASMVDAPYFAPEDGAPGSVQVQLTTSWAIHELGIVHLPASEVPITSPSRAKLSVLTSTSALVYDDFWLMNLDTGVVSWFAGLSQTTTRPSRAVMRSATLDSPRPQWLVGQRGAPELDVDATRRMRSPGTHEFAPGLMNIYVISPGGSVRVTVTAYERSMHHVTRKAS